MKLPIVDAMNGSKPAANCRLGGGCGGSQSRSAAPAAGADLPAAVLAKVRNHPCYSEEAHHHFARMHVAVAPACNIQCHYCNRKYDCASESRPGVVSERLAPEDAVRKVLAVAAEVPQLAVVGIAGPGDALANPEATFRTLELVREAAPDLKLCLSTNGLALPDHVERLAALGVEHVTVTINMTDPEVGERIYPWVSFRGRRHRGREASRLLSERQLEGLERAAARGLLCKVNSVLIPGVNDAHLPAVSRTVRALGAFVHNVMPLISAPEHGTHYGLTGQRGPTPAEVEAVQARCGDARIMRHCRQCRADAVGMLGQDRSREFALSRLPAGGAAATGAGAAAGTAARAAHRELVERRRDRMAAARATSLARVASLDASLEARVAVATRGEGRVNQHFGHAEEFQVYAVSRAGARLVAARRVETYCSGGAGEDDRLPATLRAISDCHAVLVARIGRCPREALAAAGVEAVEEHAHAFIEAAALAWFADWVARVAHGDTSPAPRPGPDAVAPAPAAAALAVA